MSISQHVTYRVGGTIYIDLDKQPTNALVTIRKGDGTYVCNAQSATISTANTVLNAAASKGALSFTVANSSGIAAGGRVFIQDDPEEVLVRKTDGGTITIRRPLLYDHVNNSKVEGSRISFNVNSAVANSLWWDGHAEWNVSANALHMSAVECTKYPLDISTFKIQDLFNEEPKLYHMIDSEWDAEQVRELARNDVLRALSNLAPDKRARVYACGPELSQAAVYAAMMRIYRPQRGDDAKELFNRYQSAFNDEIQSIVSNLPRDADQDMVVESDEQITGHSIRIRR